MNYTSTRNSNEKISSSEAILRGISGDGGLFVPDSFPQVSLDSIKQMSEMAYRERAAYILRLYLTDMSDSVIADCVEKAYGDRFDCRDIAPVKKINNNEWMLELWHGPTLAFKDMELQLLPHLMTAAKKITGFGNEIMILVATSGDTGKAALEGFCDVEGVSIAVFYPQDGVSSAQKLQMTTQKGKNVRVCAIRGNFDDAQTGVKKIFGDKAVAAELDRRGISLSSANSINWGRLVPQIVYYFSAYAELVKSGSINLGDKINFTVPTGNFGNILAGYYAKRMGLPINKLICASNVNNVLTDFFNDGSYLSKRKFYKTISPSMDILVSSNLERLLYELNGRDDRLTSEWMKSLNETGRYEISSEMVKTLNSEFWADYVDDGQTKSTIGKYYNDYGYLMDTHTAVAQSVYDKYTAATKDLTPTVIVSTASPFKFAGDVLEAIDKPADCDEFGKWDKLAYETGIRIPSPIEGLRQQPILHKDVCDKDKMVQYILKAEGA